MLSTPGPPNSSGMSCIMAPVWKTVSNSGTSVTPRSSPYLIVASKLVAVPQFALRAAVGRAIVRAQLGKEFRRES